jgi:adenine deaminase
MATLNAALHFRLEGEVGSLSPGRWADVILAEDISEIIPSYVFFKGKVVAERGSLVADIPAVDYPEWLRHTVKVTRGLKPEHFRLEAKGASVGVQVIQIQADQIVNHAIHAVLPVVNGNVVADVKNDYLKLAVVERYGKGGSIGISFAEGFGLKRGAISSSVAHDHHNIIVVGVDEASMATCVRATAEMQGGLVVASGNEVLASLPLPLGGLLSDEPAHKVITSLKKINEKAANLGCSLPAPFMSLSFVSLPTVPERGLTDRGLVDVHAHKLISSFTNNPVSS